MKLAAPILALVLSISGALAAERVRLMGPPPPSQMRPPPASDPSSAEDLIKAYEICMANTEPLSAKGPASVHTIKFKDNVAAQCEIIESKLEARIIPPEEAAPATAQPPDMALLNKAAEQTSGP